MAVTSAGRVTSKCADEECLSAAVSVFLSMVIYEFAARGRVGQIAPERVNPQPSATSKLPGFILDPSGLSDKWRGRPAFRMNTPSMRLAAQGSVVANFFVQIGHCQKELQ
jgi:hypothetical protein